MLPIAIIGAGLAGLTCAAHLQRAGRTVQVFDKSRAVGGRLARRRLGPASVDLGAQYCTAYSPEFRAALQHWQAAGALRTWSPRLGVWRAEGVRELADGQPRRWVGVPTMRMLAEHDAGTLDVRLQTRVAPLPTIDASHAALRLCDTDGRSLGEFAQVLVAVPAEQAAALLVHWPQAAAVAAQVQSWPCLALGVRLTPSPECAHDALFGDGERLSWLAAEHSKPGRTGAPCWIFHAAGEWSSSHWEKTDDDLRERLLGEGLQQAGLDPARVVDTTLHRWRYARSKVPLTCGSWLADDGRIGLAGDWLAGDRVEGAWSSGRHLARQVLERAP